VLSFLQEELWKAPGDSRTAIQSFERLTFWREKSMKKTLIAIGMVFVAVCGVGAALADHHEGAEDRVVEIWYCKVEEGMTMDDVKAANAKWVKHVNATVDGGGINSYILTPVVGKQGGFMYADSFPSMKAWNASREAMKSGDGPEIDKALEAAADCSSNTLHRSTES
jgi:hypothetical protein